MLTFDKFTGINNVLPSERLKPTDLAMAMNVDIGLSREVLRRSGFARASATRHENVHETGDFTLATRGVAGDLVNITDDVVLYPSLGHDRVWYCNLPDGRTTFSNGLINGVVSATEYTKWGVPLPGSMGAPLDVAGQLNPGSYQYGLAYRRSSDGLEGGLAYAAPVTIAAGGLEISGLPTLTGHTINVYLSSAYGGQMYYAGNTSSGIFTYDGTTAALTKPSRTDFMHPAPVGTVTAMWNGRVLVAVGPVLYASRHGQFELFSMEDFKQFSADITLIQSVEDGLYVGTEKELAFLSGRAFDKLSYKQVVDGSVVLGSGVAVDGELIRIGDAVGKGEAMVCIADRTIIAGFEGGVIARMSEGRYGTSVEEVAATFRMRDGIPQYIAVAQ